MSRLLLECYRNYLKFLVHLQFHDALRVKVDPSDLTQDTFVNACGDFGGFRGNFEPELIAWLRRTLVHNLADVVKHHQAGRRRLDRQQSLEAMLERSSIAARNALARDFSTPSARASRREQGVILADGMGRLAENYREVLELRHLEHLEFKEIAARLENLSGAVRMIWARAIQKLLYHVDSGDSG